MVVYGLVFVAVIKFRHPDPNGKYTGSIQEGLGMLMRLSVLSRIYRRNPPALFRAKKKPNGPFQGHQHTKGVLFKWHICI